MSKIAAKKCLNVVFMLNVKNDSLVLSAKKNGIDIFTRLEDKIVYHSLMGPPSLMYSRPE